MYNDLIGRRSHLGVAGVIFDAQGRVLLVHQNYGKRGWDVPGGGRERRESLEQALRRELHEEIGVQIANAELCGVYYEPAVDQHHFAFRCELAPGAGATARSPEILECGYFSVDDLPRPVNDFTVQRINDAKDSRTPTKVAVLGDRRWLNQEG